MVKPVRYVGTPTGTQLPALPSAAEATMVAPAFSASEFVDNLTAGLGMALGDRVEGVGQMVAHPVNTAREFANTLLTVARNPRSAGNALLDAAVGGVKRASSGPLGFGEVAGQFLPMPKAPPVLRNELIVHHGTPHRFPATEANPLGEFDASKVGTGEGAQVYGHGIYLAESPEVATAYKTALEAGKGDRDEDVIARLLAATKGDRAAAAEEFRQRAKFANYPEGKQRMLSLAEKVEQGVDPRGSVYKADLPDEMIGRMLDWDKPLSEQPKNVQAALAKLGDPQEKLNAYDDALLKALFEDAADPGSVPRNPSGADILKKLENQYGRKGASDYLRSLGIPGIRYLDAGSRGQDGSLTRNFVVFPGEEKKVRILDRK